MSINSTSPATLFGGSWERLKGGFLYGCMDNTGFSSFTGTLSQGPSVNVTGSTALTIEQMPAHSHTIRTSAPIGGIASGWDNSHNYPARGADNSFNDNSTQDRGSTGGGEGHTHSLSSHTHAISYMAVFVWKRVA